MTFNAVILTVALVLSGTVLAQSSGPSAGAAEAGQGAAVTTGQAPSAAKKPGEGGTAVDKTARPAKPDASEAGVNRSRKADRRLEHYP